MTIKSAMEVVEVKLHTQDQSNNQGRLHVMLRVCTCTPWFVKSKENIYIYICVCVCVVDVLNTLK